MDSHNTPLHPLTASIAATLAQLSPKDQASVVSGFYALAAPYLGGRPADAEKPPSEPEAVQGEPIADEPATPAPKLTEDQKTVLRQLRRGPAKGANLALQCGKSVRTIHRWCGPTDDRNVLYRVGVRADGDQYVWPQPDDDLCG